MLFAKHLRDGIRRGRIRCTVRIWARPHVKVGGRYQMDDGQIVVDSIVPIGVRDITRDLARESGFSTVKHLLQIAKHGRGDNVYLIRFHYLAPGAWDVPRVRGAVDEEGLGARDEAGHPRQSRRTPTLLQRIQRSAAGRHLEPDGTHRKPGIQSGNH